MYYCGAVTIMGLTVPEAWGNVIECVYLCVIGKRGESAVCNEINNTGDE